MHIVRLTDGLGNQLFQLAFAYALRKLTGTTVLLDRSWFPEFGGKLNKAVPRNFCLSPYANIDLAYADPRLVDELTYGKGLKGSLNKFLHRRTGLVREGSADISPEALRSLGRDYVFRVFAQKAFYPDMVREELLDALALPPEVLNEANLSLAEEIGRHDSIAVHIRRGDYLQPHSLQVHGLCPAEY